MYCTFLSHTTRVSDEQNGMLNCFMYNAACLLICLQANFALPSEDGQWLNLSCLWRVLTIVLDVLD